jgi:hypothetical protein
MHNLRWFIPLVVVLVISGLSRAAESQDKKMRGKELYKEYCRPCHLKDSPRGEYSPLTLIQEQWETFFSKKLEPSHKEVADPNHGGKKVLEVLSPEQIKAIRKFCVDHAADSEQPQTCG